jgi:DNA-binding transcriptional LysR family regulator
MVMEDMVAPFIADGHLVRVLEDWSPPFSGYHLYYPNRRHPSPAFAALLEELRANRDGCGAAVLDRTTV